MPSCRSRASPQQFELDLRFTASVWPPERNRKPLWADFIPADVVDDWIDQEKASQAGGRSVAKKWEVVYHNIDSDRLIEATLEEVSDHPTSRPAVPRQHSISGPGSSDARSAREFERPAPEPRAAPQKVPITEPRAPSSFSTLDQLFNSTTTKASFVLAASLKVGSGQASRFHR